MSHFVYRLLRRSRSTSLLLSRCLKPPIPTQTFHTQTHTRHFFPLPTPLHFLPLPTPTFTYNFNALNMNTNTRAKKPKEKQSEEKKLEEKKRSILLRVLLFVALTILRGFLGAFGDELYHHSKALSLELWRKLLNLYLEILKGKG